MTAVGVISGDVVASCVGRVLAPFFHAERGRGTIREVFIQEDVAVPQTVPCVLALWGDWFEMVYK